MPTDRRRFLQTSAAAAFAGLGWPYAATQDAKPTEGKRLLVLGGTSFLGPALIETALARGHRVSIFTSGRAEQRREEAGRPSVVPEGVEELIGNRDPELTADDRRLAGDPDIESKRDPNSPKGLSQLEGREWDGVIDTSGYFPRMVRASAELLAPRVDRYVFVSTISVYADNSKPGMDETAELAQLADPTTEEFGAQFENYGAAKAACEAAAGAAMPGRTANVRPGFIVGPRDVTRRFVYWPWRAAQGGTMLVPGTPLDPIQLIDVRDLAAFLIHLIETGTTGVFNATGPEKGLTMRGMLEGCRAAAGADEETDFLWADPAFVTEKGVPAPMWVPPSGETAGFHRVDVGRALKAGLRCRPIEDTARATLEWHASLPEAIGKGVLPPASLEAEAKAVAEWRERER